MLEAANARPRFTISLKRSTQNLPLSTSSLADYPIYATKSDDRLSNCDPSLRASFYRKRLESAHLAIFVDVSDQFILRGAFGFLF